MSKLIHRILAAAFVLGVAAALAVGTHAAFAARRALQCPCDPLDPGADRFCEECCNAVGSVCPWSGGGERECLCA
jgi:hypothetical protein